MNTQQGRPNQGKRPTRKNDRIDYYKAELVFAERNLVASADPTIIGWLGQGIADLGFDAPVKRGEVEIRPLHGPGPSMKFPHAAPALRWLREQSNYPPVSVHFIDQENERLIWRFGEETVWIDLTKPLEDHTFVDVQLHRILKTLDATPQQRAAVFPNYAPRGVARVAQPAAGVTSETPSQAPEQGVSEILLSDLELEARVVKAFRDAGLNSIGEVLDAVKEKGVDGLLALNGIGEKSLKELKKALEKRGFELSPEAAE